MYTRYIIYSYSDMLCIYGYLLSIGKENHKSIVCRIVDLHVPGSCTQAVNCKIIIILLSNSIFLIQNKFWQFFLNL